MTAAIRTLTTLADGVDGIRKVILLHPGLFQSATALVNGDARKVWIVAVAAATQILDNTGRAEERQHSPFVDALFSNLHFASGMALQEARIDAKAFYAKLPGFIEKLRKESEQAMPKETAH